MPGGLARLRQLLRRGLEETAALFPAVRESYRWVKRAARILKNEEGLPAKQVRRRPVQLLRRQPLLVLEDPGVGLTHLYDSRTAGNSAAVASNPPRSNRRSLASPPGRSPARAATRSRLAAIRLSRSCSFSPEAANGGSPSSVKAARTAAQ